MTKEIEWWNEITPWKNRESKRYDHRIIILHLCIDFNMKITEEFNYEGKKKTFAKNNFFYSIIF